MNIALVNTNLIKPPIAPIALDYLAEALNAKGYCVEILDLCWAEDIDQVIKEFFKERDFSIVGVTLRNTDDCAFTSRQSFLQDFIDIVGEIKKYSDAFIIAGGVGFSIMPGYVLSLCAADAGIWGEGEFGLVNIAECLDEGIDWRGIPGLFYIKGGKLFKNPPLYGDMPSLPSMSRGWIDNKRYFIEGGQCGFETKRGCNLNCIYCADPLAKGKKVRVRPPDDVVDELKCLLTQGIDHLHTCDSEFNLPKWHAVDVCKGIINAGLNNKLRWYAYCSPVPFSMELASLMKQAGCVGINFGVDNGDKYMIRKLRRNFGPEDIMFAVECCKRVGIVTMLDLLLGSPGETGDSIRNTVELMKHIDPDRIGISAGIRIYPGTQLDEMIKGDFGLRRGCIGGDGQLDPQFYIDQEVAPFIFSLLDELIGNDERFLFFDTSRPDRNYNYNANERLSNAIREGYRGAYWDILRHC